MSEQHTSPRPMFKFFCDESCHMQHDGAEVMVLGTLFCPADQLESVVRTIKYLRHQHNSHNEIKWTKLISKQEAFYKALVDYLFVSPLRFKSTVVQEKSKLNHALFNQDSHNDFYYKMFYYTLRDFLQDGNSYRIYLDYMDTHGGEKITQLKKVLVNDCYGKGKDIQIEAQTIRSYESQVMQLCDLLIGAVAYKNRSDIPKTSKIKNSIVAYVEQKFGACLNKTTPPWEEKFNLFLFQPRSQNAE